MTTKIVVDASVWIDHFRRTNWQLLALLKDHRVVTHQLLLGELRCGSVPSPRAASLEFLANLIQMESVDIAEVLAEVELREMYGSGCGLVDMAILIATLRMPQAKLWSRDKKMQRLAAKLGIPLLAEDATAATSVARQLTAASPTA
jgi:predicted nucleic acid-binding protein